MSQPFSGANRRKLLLAAAAALTLAVAIGVIWGLAGTEAAEDTSASEPGLPADDAELDVDEPGTQEQPAGPRTGGGLPTNGTSTGTNTGSSSDSGPGSSSGSGSGSGSTDGGEPDNQPPVIEDIGVTSTGLTLRFDPHVSDPDGDEVSVDIEVDGETVDDPTEGVRFPHNEVGDKHEVSVTVIATDDSGASTEQSKTHTLFVLVDVTLKQMRFTVPHNDCFGDEATPQRLTGTVQLAHAVSMTKNIDEVLVVERPDVVLIEDEQGRISGGGGIWVSAKLTFAGQTHSYEQLLSDDRTVFEAFEGQGDCRALFSYRVDFERF